MAKDALAAHARDELGISDETSARPIQAAVASAASFVVGGALPLVAAIVSPRADVAVFIALTSLVILAVLGAVGANAGGAPMLRATIRVTFWGAVAMAVTAGVGVLVGGHITA